ncbi:MAG: hypothetical protein WC521_05165 [Bdellovibrionales bacterium]|jgi:hypothetical protein
MRYRNGHQHNPLRIFTIDTPKGHYFSEGGTVTFVVTDDKEAPNNLPIPDIYDEKKLIWRAYNKAKKIVRTRIVPLSRVGVFFENDPDAAHTFAKAHLYESPGFIVVTRPQYVQRVYRSLKINLREENL